MMTDEQLAKLEAFMDEQIARGLESCRLQEGDGVVVQASADGGQTVALDGGTETVADEDETEVRTTRFAHQMLVEKKGNKLYFNVPPVHDVLPLVDGQSVFAYPRPYLPVPANGWVLALRYVYQRAEVSIQDDPPTGNYVRPALTVSGVEAEVFAYSALPADVEPPDPGDPEKVLPWAGEYIRYIELAQITDGEVVLTGSFGNLIGGFHITSPGYWDADPFPGTWTWQDALAAP